MLNTIRSGGRAANRWLPTALAIAVMLGISACSSDEPAPAAGVGSLAPEPTGTASAPPPTTTTAPAPTSSPAPALPDGYEVFAQVPGVIDPTNFGWPRAIESSTGRITIESKPERVYSLSLGHAEIIAAVRGGDVLVATASFFKDPGTSASYSEFAGSPDAGSDPEEIVALDPEIVIASAFTSADLVSQLTSVGINVVRADLDDSALGNVPNILLLGYMLGVEDRALELAAEVTARVNYIAGTVEAADPPRPNVLAMSRFSDIYVAGSGSTEGGIIEAAGAVNTAAESGVEGHQVVGIEGIAAMNPDIILLTQPEASALQFAEELYTDPALANVPAVQNNMIVYGDPTFYTTLSHWNVRGIEESAKAFYPDLFEGVTFEPFTHP